MSRRVVAGIIAGLVGVLGAAVVAVPGIAGSQGGTKSQLSAQELGTGKQLVARLSNMSEVPPVAPEASGVANIWVDTITNQICWTIAVGNLPDVTLAHIHQAPIGQNGPIVVDLMPPLPLP